MKENLLSNEQIKSLKDLLMNLLRCKSITPDEAGVFALCSSALADFTPRQINAPNDAPAAVKASNLLLQKQCNPSGKIHLVFGCHADVVPAGSGWHSEPFNPVEQNGRIIARGAADMKAGLAAAVAACMAFKPENNSEIASLSVLITSDEEGEGTYGSAYALERLAAEGVRFSDAIITEPTCDVRFGDTIKTARRGSIHVNIRFIGRGGHIAYAAQCNNPIELAAPALMQLAGAQLDAGCGVFLPSKLVISNIHAGVGALNVSPQELIIDANVRNSPLSDEASVRAFCERVCGELEAVQSGKLQAQISVRTSSLPFSCDENCALISTLASAVREISGTECECNAAGGTSDARHFAAAGANACEFGPRNEGIHGPNEGVEFAEVIGCAQIYLQTINNLRS